MQPTDFLNQTVRVVIDCPLGSRHPTHGLVYLLNYGFVLGRAFTDQQLRALTEFQKRFLSLSLSKSDSSKRKTAATGK